MADFYVYAYIDLKSGIPFYIGKGHGSRDKAHLYPSTLKRDSFFYRKLRRMLSHNCKLEIHHVMEGLTEEEAFYWESFFIKALGRRNLNTGCLCNLTDGGEGFAGYTVTEARRKQSADAARYTKNHTGHAHSEETKNRIAAKLREIRTGWTLSKETKQKIGNAHRGRKHTDEAKARMSAGQKKRFARQEERDKIARSHTGKRHSDKTCRKMPEARRGRTNSVKSRARQSFTKWKKHWLKSGGITRLESYEVQLWQTL